MTRASVDLFRLLVDVDRDWQQQAACRGVDVDLFFSERTGEGKNIDTAKAVALCHTCPVETRCLEYALANHENIGVWGGMSGRQRRNETSRRYRDRRRTLRQEVVA